MGEGDAIKTCGWRTGVNTCRMLRGTDKHCLWHRYWIRLVDVCVPGRSQEDEFVEWWEQFQPYGIYGDRPGQWWGSIDALWPALTGAGDPPVLTQAMENELLLRRAQVRRYQLGVPWGSDPWPRISGEPLPVWDEWMNKIHGSLLAKKQCG